MTNTRPIPLFDVSPSTERSHKYRPAIAQTAIGTALQLGHCVPSVVGAMEMKRRKTLLSYEQFDRLLVDNFLATCSRCHKPPRCSAETKPVILAEAQENQQNRQCTPTKWIYFVQVAAVSAFVSLRRAMADNELSRPLELPDFKSAVMCHHAAMYQDLGHSPLRMAFPAVVGKPVKPHEELQTANQPLKFSWSKTRRKIRAAAKGYSENTHADY